MCDCKVMVNECVAKQHGMMVRKMALIVKKKKAEEVKSKIRLWELKETSCQEACREEVTRIWEKRMGYLMSRTKQRKC